MLSYNLSEIPEEYRDLARANSKVEPGFVRKLMKNSWDTLGDVKDGLLEKLKPTSFSAEQKTTNSGNTHQQQSSKESVKQESKHNEPPSSNSTSSINDKNENVKPLEYKTIADQSSKLIDKEKEGFINRLNNLELDDRQKIKRDDILSKLENNKPVALQELKELGLSRSDIENYSHLLDSNFITTKDTLNNKTASAFGELFAQKRQELAQLKKEGKIGGLEYRDKLTNLNNLSNTISDFIKDGENVALTTDTLKDAGLSVEDLKKAGIPIKQEGSLLTVNPTYAGIQMLDKENMARDLLTGEISDKLPELKGNKKKLAKDLIDNLQHNQPVNISDLEKILPQEQIENIQNSLPNNQKVMLNPDEYRQFLTNKGEAELYNLLQNKRKGADKATLEKIDDIENKLLLGEEITSDDLKDIGIKPYETNPFLSDVKNTLENKKFKKPEKIEAQQRVLKALEEGADINPHDLMTLGYSQRDIKMRQVQSRIF
jgi:uncharacterized protein YjiS (DUF1127 family)